AWPLGGAREGQGCKAEVKRMMAELEIKVSTVETKLAEATVEKNYATLTDLVEKMMEFLANVENKGG
ncbi:unnamed protein product, partial [Ilex paraguariensis]